MTFERLYVRAINLAKLTVIATPDSSYSDHNKVFVRLKTQIVL